MRLDAVVDSASGVLSRQFRLFYLFPFLIQLLLLGFIPLAAAILHACESLCALLPRVDGWGTSGYARLSGAARERSPKVLFIHASDMLVSTVE